MERFKDCEMRGRSGCPRVGWEVKQHNGELAFGLFGAAHLDERRHFSSERRRTFGAALHCADIVGHGEFAVTMATGAAFGRTVGTATENAGDNRAVEFGDRHHHRGFERQQAKLTSAPLFERLKLDRVRRDIRHIHLRERFDRCIDIIIGRAANEREAGQVDDGIDGGFSVTHEIFVDGGA